MRRGSCEFVKSETLSTVSDDGARRCPVPTADDDVRIERLSEGSAAVTDALAAAKDDRHSAGGCRNGDDAEIRVSVMLSR